MAAELLNGIESIEIGAPGADGAPGTTLTRVSPITDGSVTLTIPEKATNDIRAEDVAGIVASLEADSEPMTLVFSTLDMSNETLQKLFGGSINTNVYSFPAEPANIELTIKLTSKPIRGKKHVWTFPLVSAYSSLSGNITRSDLTSATMTARILTPTDATGAALAPFTREIVTV